MRRAHEDVAGIEICLFTDPASGLVEHLTRDAHVVADYERDTRSAVIQNEAPGVELVVEGKRADGKPVTYVLRGFSDGTLDSLTVGGASEVEAKAFGEATKYAAAVDKKLWRSEWAIPFAALRFAPSDKAVLPLNVTVYRSENNAFIQF